MENIKYKNKFSHTLTTLTQMLLPESLSMCTLQYCFTQKKNVFDYQQFIPIRRYPPKVGGRVCCQMPV